MHFIVDDASIFFLVVLKLCPNYFTRLLSELVQSYEKQEGAELEVCAAFAWRRRDLAEELGDAMSARAASLHQRDLARVIRRRSRKEKNEQPPVPLVFIFGDHCLLLNSASDIQLCEKPARTVRVLYRVLLVL